MFREMRRKKQEISREECVRILKEEVRGVLSVNGENGYPYGVPMDFWYDEEADRIYFHGAKEGHKIDALKKDDKVSFCVFDQGYRKEGEWAYNVNSVIIFGRIRFIDDVELRTKALRNMGVRYTTDNSYIEYEIENSSKNVLCLELIPEHMTGKLVNES